MKELRKLVRGRLIKLRDVYKPGRRRWLLATASLLAFFLFAAEQDTSVKRIRPRIAVAAAEERQDCNQATVAGAYGFRGEGILNFSAPQQVQAAEVGLATADGTGNLSGSVTFSVNGQVLATPFTGTYQVDSDCGITETLLFGNQIRHQRGVIVRDAEEIDFIATDPGSILTRVAERIHSR